MKLLGNQVLITLFIIIINSNQNLLNAVLGVSASPLDDVLSKFETTLKSLDFEKIGSDFASDADDLLRYNLGLTNEDRYLTGLQLLIKYGFPYETYTVETCDEYLLEVVRIPGKGAAILMVHGLLSSWEDFVTPGPNLGLPYLLSRKGFDVWFLNCRGNKFSRKHITLSPKKKEFWEFSWHEMGTRDVPATVDKILSVTGKKKIIYIGHSQGTTVGFVWLSERPEYNSVVTLMISLAPIGYLNHVKSPLVLALTPLRNELAVILNALGHGQVFPRDGFVNVIKNLLCSTTVTADFICSNIVFLFSGFDYAQLNYKTTIVVLAHVPSGSSVKQLLHYAQEVASGRFRQLDYGKEKNLKVYKSEVPPDYNISNIKAPVALYHSKNDWLADPTDVERLSEEFPNLVEKYLVPFDKFNHFDFLWAKDVVPLVYNRVLKLVEDYT